MENITQELNGDILTLTIDLSKRGNKSKSGKSMIIASSEGNKKIKGTEIFMGVNVYTKEGVE
jgi:hypothetical protein